MVSRNTDRRRRGTILPLLAVCMIGLFGFCGLAIDLGLLAVSRTQCQNAADTAALSACRLLNTKVGSVNSNLAPAIADGKTRITSNSNLNQAFTNAAIQKIEAGQYLYDTTSQIFRVVTWTDVTNNQSITPAGGGSWTAIRVTVSVPQRTYFMRAFGVNSMPTGAKATAVFRPRDVAFALDMTGSMAFGSTFNLNGKSMNPDNLVPSFGHYANIPAGNGTGSTAIRCIVNQANGSGEAIAQNNYTVEGTAGPPIVRNFYFDPANINSPATPAFPLTTTGGTPNLINAFHRWSPPESGANPDTYTPPVYNFTGYNAFHKGNEAPAMGPTPAPGSFGTMTDDGAITYVGDRWRRADGSLNKTDTTWLVGAPATKAAISAIDLLGYNVNTGNVRTGTSDTTIIAPVTQFRDLVWETHGYDLDIVKYRTTRGNAAPMRTDDYTLLVPLAEQLVPEEDRFKGYSMGPGYWGKTFFIWPPDPRAPVGNPGDANYVPGDWRRRYFDQPGGTAFNPQNDNMSGGTVEGINEALLNTGSGPVLATGTTKWIPDYAAILKWIKSGPLVLPPNLRAGHVLYYSSIPDDVNTATGGTQEVLDKVWWKRYIDYVLSYNRNTTGDLYGSADSWSLTGAGRSVGTADLVNWTGPLPLTKPWPNAKPYMPYNDSPNRPRLHFWFGPLTMMDFMGISANWLPGTSNEAQCWQLKAGMNSVLDDIKNNHPNNYVGLSLFSYSHHNGIRSPMGQNFKALKNALFFPKSLLNTINLENSTTSVTCEIRPYNTSFSGVSNNEIPNAIGSTDPNTGLGYAFNLLSPSATLPTGTYGTTKARRGASKMVIFETDGVPNSYRNFTFNKAGYDSYYSDSTGGVSGSNGDATSISSAIAIITQMKVQMATTNGAGTDSGLSLPNAPVRVYPIAFGDLFDVALAPAATFRPTALKFMADVGAAGNTNAAGLSSPPANQIITGVYQNRIDTLKTCMENIFQSGVGVTLVE
ncbi:MAG: hypothetical protein C0467_30380 [Planctomycetaceae bacterium]|nr:hypothetical protein [Planctomycetaceae bacterium]